MGTNTVTFVTDDDFLAPAAEETGSGEAAAFSPSRRLLIRIRVPHETQAPAWLTDVLRRLREIEDLPRDWDGRNARATSPDALTRAFVVLNKFMSTDFAAPAVVPTPDGGMQFEWHDAGWDVQVEIDPSGEADAWGEHLARGTRFYGDVDSQVEDLRLAIKEITVRQRENVA